MRHRDPKKNVLHPLEVEDVVVLSARLLGPTQLATDYDVGSKKKASATLERMTDAFVRVQVILWVEGGAIASPCPQALCIPPPSLVSQDILRPMHQTTRRSTGRTHKDAAATSWYPLPYFAYN